MKSLFRTGLQLMGCLLATVISSYAGVITIDFGAGTHVFSTWPGSAAGASSTVGVALPSPLLLDVGELQMTAAGGSLVCAGSTTNLALCANSAAYGLGITGGAQDPRVDEGEVITLTLTVPSYTVKLVSFTVTGFSGGEQGQYRINGGTQNVFTAPTATITPASPVAFTTVAWTVPTGNGGNYSLSSITLDISAPEPGTFAVAGLALTALGLASRRRRTA